MPADLELFAAEGGAIFGAPPGEMAEDGGPLDTQDIAEAIGAAARGVLVLLQVQPPLLLHTTGDTTVRTALSFGERCWSMVSTRAVGEVLLLDLAKDQRCGAVPPCAERHCSRRLIASYAAAHAVPPREPSRLTLLPARIFKRRHRA